MQYYFAYGSNLHHEQMKRRCPKCRYIKKYTLNNFQLTFRSKYGAADIQKKIGDAQLDISNDNLNIENSERFIDGAQR